MNNDELFRRVVAENFELKDKLNETEKRLASEHESMLLWFQSYSDLKQKSAGEKAEEDLPLTPEGANAICRMASD